MPDLQMVLDRLEREGLRLTGPRQTVVEEILRYTEPFTSAELWSAIQEHAPAIGRATVFRTLDLLARLGLIQRIHDDAEGGRCHAYLACDMGHHHHLICRRCGTVADFAEDGALDALVDAVQRRTAFRVEGHRLELIGCCPACQATG